MKPAVEQLKIGDVFTPQEWGYFAIRQFGLFDMWTKGATIFDPTMGTGDLLKSLVNFGLEQGYRLDELPIDRLYGNELNNDYFTKALEHFRDEYNADMSANFTNEDITSLERRKYDVLFGNPPWQNFVDLPGEYKEHLKPYFLDYDLVENSQSLLLGGSRIDIAALVINICMKDFLVSDGSAFFFMPLSILLNDGANRAFRSYLVSGRPFAPLEVFDLQGTTAFPGVSTRYGLASFQGDRKPVFPIPYHCFEDNHWVAFYAKPVYGRQDALSIVKGVENDAIEKIDPIIVSKRSRPRQGVNTSGANSVFFFDDVKLLNEDRCLVNGTFPLPRKYVYPLLTSRNFKEGNLQPYKYVLLPYSKSGKPLSPEALVREADLQAYLNHHENTLRNRKGTMLNAVMKRGLWWSMLGVGEYSFAKYKIVWEAYGKKEFRPMIVPGHYQANQSLQASIPVDDQGEAQRILNKLLDPRIESYLLSHKMAGTMNWAQPGKIKKFLAYKEDRE